MLPQRESLTAVTGAGVVAIIFASFGILGGILMEVVIWVAPMLSGTEGHSAFPAGMRPLVAVIYLFFLALAVGQLIVAINILRRRNWARIAIIVWAAIMAALSGLAAFFMLFVFSLPMPDSPGTKDIGPILIALKFFLLVVYGVPCGVGIWWLILFTRPRVVAAFQNPVAAFPAPQGLDPSGFPAPPQPLPASNAPRKPSCPIPIALVAAFDVSGAVSMILALFLPLPFQMPFFLFGAQIQHFPYKVFLALLGISYIVFVVGIFKLKRWGLDSLLVVKSLLLLSGIVTLFNPNFMLAMDEMMKRVLANYPAFPGGNPFLSHKFQEGMLGISYAFGVALIVLALIYRGRFLKAAAEAAT